VSSGENRENPYTRIIARHLDSLAEIGERLQAVSETR
jgi:hypothetical protein